MLALFVRGLHRELSDGQQSLCTPLYLENVHAMLDAIDRDQQTQLREVAFVLLADLAPLPVNVLRLLHWHQLRLGRDRIVLDIPPRSGARWPTCRIIVLGTGGGATCPVAAMQALSLHVGPTNGYVFESRGGQPLGKVTTQRLLAALPNRRSVWSGESTARGSAGADILLPLVARLRRPRPKQVRDAALISVAFAACLNPEEARSLDVRHVTHKSGWLVLDIAGRTDRVAVPAGRAANRCPVTAWEAWLYELKSAGADFDRQVAFPQIRQGRIRPGERLNGDYLTWHVRKRCEQAGLEGDFAFTSLRTGFIRSAARAEVPEHLILRQAGLTRLDSVQVHVRRERLLSHNVASMLGL
jgi:hypothetical protein